MEKLRFATVSGQFYPSDSAELSKEIDNYISSKATNSKCVKALIVPHAGYIYSGKVAGEGFSFLTNQNFDEVFIFGTPHFSQIKDIRIANYKEWETPLGRILQSERIKEIIESNKEVSLNVELLSEGFESEHSIEVQLPFIQKAISNTNLRIIPCLIGEGSPRLMSSFFTNIIDPKDLIICSTDLSHYYTAEISRKMDEKLITAIINKDINTLESEQVEACGINGIKVLTQIAIEKNWTPKLIKYDNSGTYSGDLTRVVGYASILYFEQ